MVNLCFDSSFNTVLYICPILHSAPFFLTVTVFNVSLSHLRKLSDLALSFLTLSLLRSALGFHVSVCVCVCVMLVFAGGPANPGSPPKWPSVYPAAHSLPNTAAFKSTGNAMKGRVHSSLCLSHCYSLFALSLYVGVLLIAFVGN